MNILVPFLVAAAAVALTPALAQPAQPGSAAHQPKAAKVHTRADVSARIARHFARMDANRDGFVAQAEVQALHAQRAQKHAQRAQKRAQRAEQRAQRRDPGAMFARLDANRDGQITVAEAEAARAARLTRRNQARPQAQESAGGALFARADANRDGVITRAEFDAVPRPGRAGMMHGRHAGRGLGMFTRADADRDGRVSLAEAQQAALLRFDRLDLNRDGQLTPEERRQARQQLRAQRPRG